MKTLCNQIHALGLKVGIYSSPWITTFAGYRGGSSDSADGHWEKLKNYEANKRLGKYSFTANDAVQFGEWGIDYLKYDWSPNDVPHTVEMSEALQKTGRDIIYSLSCAAPFDQAADWARLANCWRTTGDIGMHGSSLRNHGSTAFRNLHFARIVGRPMPVRGIGTIRICSKSDMWVEDRIFT